VTGATGPREPEPLVLHGCSFPPGRLLVMAIVNRTPDSFYRPGLARDLLATGRAAWQVLVGAMSTQGTVGVPAGQVLYADAPLGVGYFVAVLDPPDREPVPVPRA
jgi:hypothetical protein